MTERSDCDALAAEIWNWLADVPDPEIPVVSIIDLGMVRNVRVDNTGVNISVSPTYSGCPATEMIEENILQFLRDKGLEDVSVTRTLRPAWTTDWITESGREKLRDYGIAPPVRAASKGSLLGKPALHCPRCNSDKTEMVSEFGSTACKAAYKCASCLEPFEYFKCI